VADGLAPTTVHVAPDGTITYDFTGHVHAEGFDLDADTAKPPSNLSKVRWLRAVDGVVVAELYADDVAGDAELVVQADAPSGDATTRLSLNAGAPNNFLYACGLTATALIADGLNSEVGAFGRSGSVTIVDGSMRSSFLQLVGRLKRRIDCGSLFVTWPGGDAVSNRMVVNHALGVTPIAVVADSDGGLNWVAHSVQGVGASHFDLLARTVDGGVPAAGSSQLARWIAIG
jgi:hypothetical protein